MKKLKYVLIALAVILLCVGGYVLYEFKFKTYDVADAEVDKIIDETIEVELPDGTTIVLDKEGNIVEEKKSNGSSTNSSSIAGEKSSENSGNTDNGENVDENGSSNDNSAEDGSSTANNSTSQTNNDGKTNSSTSQTSNPTDKATVANIKTKYQGTFTMLENQATSKINSLIGQAKSEYSAKKSNGESIQFGYFYNKYMGAANNMESSIDAAMNTLISLVEKDLEANGFDKSYAQSFRDDYEATKKSLRDNMINKALSFK